MELEQKILSPKIYSISSDLVKINFKGVLLIYFLFMNKKGFTRFKVVNVSNIK